MMDTSKTKKTSMKSHLLKAVLAAVFVLGLTIFVNSTDVQAATKPTSLKQGYVTGLSEATGVGVGYTTGAADEMYYRIGTSKTSVTSAHANLYEYAHAYAEDNSKPYMVITGLSAGKTYYVQIGSKSTGDSDIKWSDAFEVVTAPNTAPTTLKQTKAEKKAITVSWKAASGANTYAVSTLKYGSSKWSSDKFTTKTSLRLASLSQGSAYGVEVYAARKSSSGYVAYGRGVRSTKYFATIAKKPSTPVLTERYTQSGKAYVGVKAQNYVTGYQFQIYDVSTKKSFTVKSTSNKKTAKSSKLKANHIYRIKVRSYVVNTKYHSDWSSASYFASQKKGTLKAEWAVNGIKLSWSKVGGARKYAVYASTSRYGTYRKVATTTGTSYTITKVGGTPIYSGGTYYYYVAPITKDGKSTNKNMLYSWGSTYYR